MSNPVTYTELANTAADNAQTVRLSIAIPFYNDDPGALVRALNPLIGADKSIDIGKCGQRTCCATMLLNIS